MIPWRSGLYTAEQIPESVYHADAIGDVPTLSRGVATRIVEKSLLDAFTFHPRLGGEVEEIGEQKQKNLDAGNVNHSMILGSGQAYGIAAGFDDWKTKQAREDRDAIRAEGKIPLLTKDYDKHRRIVDKALPKILAIIGRIPAEAEMTALWEEPRPDTDLLDEVLAVRCKTRIDVPLLDFPGATVRGTWGNTVLRPGAWVFDLKGAKDVGPRWERNGDPIGLDIQAYMHVHSLEVLIPELAGRVAFANIVFQTCSPWDVVVLPWPTSALELGKLRYERAVKAWAGAMASGFWAGMGGREIEVKEWQMKREYEIAMTEGDDDGSDA